MPPVNDNVVDAIVLTGSGGTVNGDTTGATAESAAELTWMGSNCPTIWYRYTNNSAVFQRVTVNNLSGDAGFNNSRGFEVDTWSYPSGLPSGFEDLDTNGTYEFWVADPDFNARTTAYTDIAPGKTLYLCADNYNYDAVGFGVFSFDWTVATAPTPAAITGFSPTSGQIGTTVVITGISFTGATSVTIGGYSTGFTVDSDTQITTQVPGVPAGPGNYIRVYTPSGLAQSAGTFTVTVDGPKFSFDDVVFSI